MIKQTPFVHCFKTREQKYIYDVNKNTVLRVPEEVYTALSRHNESSYDSEYILRLMEKGLLSSNRIESICHPENDFLYHQLSNKVQRMILQVTQQCNLRCEYCVYSGGYENRHHSNGKMSLETAIKAIDFLLSHSSEANSLSIGFYGGEPLLEFPLVKEAMEYAMKRVTKELTFSVTTNGTLLTDEIISYFEKNNVVLLISLDGPKEIHDRNRKFAGGETGTFDKIMNNLMDIRSKHPEYYKKIAFSVVLDPNSDLSCTKNFFSSNELVKDLYKSPSYVDEVLKKDEIESDGNFEEDLNYECFKLYLSKLGFIDKENISSLVYIRYSELKRFNNDLKSNPMLSKEWHHSGPCIPGVQRLLVNVNGDLFPCERVSESSDAMKIGNINEGFDLTKASTLLNIGKLSEDNCKNCWAIRFCTICAKLCDDGNQLCAKTKAINCGRVRRMVEETMKDYCTFKEFDHDFESEDELLEDFL